VLSELHPGLILVAGAMWNVDQCELEPEMCERINRRGPGETILLVVQSVARSLCSWVAGSGAIMEMWAAKT
jgi:dTDP-4-dehydrorhamnose reductase